MYTYGWFMLRFDRKQRNSVRQLSFNKKKFFFTLDLNFKCLQELQVKVSSKQSIICNLKWFGLETKVHL